MPETGRGLLMGLLRCGEISRLERLRNMLEMHADLVLGAGVLRVVGRHLDHATLIGKTEMVSGFGLAEAHGFLAVAVDGVHVLVLRLLRFLCQAHSGGNSERS